MPEGWFIDDASGNAGEAEGSIIRNEKTKNPAEAGFKIGRRERIRTSDPLVPNQLRYQAALLAEVLLFEFLVQFKEWCEGGDLNPHVRKDTNT